LTGDLIRKASPVNIGFSVTVHSRCGSSWGIGVVA